MEERQRVAKLTAHLEHLLRLRGLIDEDGEILLMNGESLPPLLEERLDGFIENAAELRGLIEVGRAVRRGERLSPTVVSAAKLMVMEICNLLDEDLQSARPRLLKPRRPLLRY